MSSRTRDAKQQLKARQRRRLQAHERLTRDRHQAQHVAEALQLALNELGLPEGFCRNFNVRRFEVSSSSLSNRAS